MKSLSISLMIVFLAVINFGCKKFLEVKPVEAVSDEVVIFDRISLETALRGAYRQAGNSGYYGENFVTMGYFPSGDIVNGTTGGGANLVIVNYRADDPIFNNAWRAIYNLLNRVNHVIEKTPGLSDPALTQALKNQYLGEAHFLRALAYFDLARSFGGVPLVLSPTKSLSELSGQGRRASLQETYNQVLIDLNKAEELLPAASTLKVRATIHSVNALKARFYLYNENWANAEEFATKIINNSQFPLSKPFNYWFANNVTASNESIFEIAFSAQNPSAIRAQMQHPNRGGTYRYFPSAAIVNILKDPNKGGTRRTLVDSVRQGNVTQWFGNLYYRQPATDPAYVLRLAEQYLIRAEARARQNNLSGALEDLNKVRDRANVPALSLDDQESIVDAVLEERRIEFLWEAHRWFDLARTRKAKTVLESLNTGVVVSDHEYVFPIPQEQVLLDPSLTQNPNY